jgi:hypothetical protein
VARALLVRSACLRYPGGMVLRFTAKVRKREVVVRGVDLPDGATVDVTIDPQEEDDIHVLTPEDLASIKEADAEFRRGEYYRGEDYTAWLRGGPRPVLVRDQPGGRLASRARAASVGARPRKRAKPAAGRPRKGN